MAFFSSPFDGLLTRDEGLTPSPPIGSASSSSGSAPGA
jgi:hypothetical protein